MDSSLPSIRSGHQRPRRGFTVVEFVVASLIVSISLLGIYSVFREVLRTDARYGAPTRQRSSAAAVARHLAEQLQHAINIPNQSAVTMQTNTDTGVSTLTVTTAPVNASYSSGLPTLEKRRYEWGFSEPDSNIETLTMKTMTFAGNVNVSNISGLDGMTEEQAWAILTPQTIGRNVDQISVTFRSLASSSSPWIGSYSGDVGDVVVRVSVNVGGQTVQHVIVPYAADSAFEG